MLRNTPHHIGLVTIVLHWLMALLVFGLFATGWYMVELHYYDSLYKTLPFLHKSIGILLAALLLCRILWRLGNPVPGAVAGVRAWEHLAGHIVHTLLYCLMAVIVVSGYLISTADGAPISVFGWFTVPALISDLPNQADTAGLVHEYFAYAIIALAGLHAAAALKHHFVNRDRTLRRMLGLKSGSQ